MTKYPRRVHDAAFKTKAVLEALEGAKTQPVQAAARPLHLS